MSSCPHVRLRRQERAATRPGDSQCVQRRQVSRFGHMCWLVNGGRARNRLDWARGSTYGSHGAERQRRTSAQWNRPFWSRHSGVAMLRSRRVELGSLVSMYLKQLSSLRRRRWFWLFEEGMRHPQPRIRVADPGRAARAPTNAQVTTPLRQNISDHVVCLRVCVFRMASVWASVRRGSRSKQ